MRIKFEDIVINLPSELDIQDRLAFVQQIISQHISKLTYQEKTFDTEHSSIGNNKLFQIRLDILATYILKADPSYCKYIMSQYKIKNRPLQEIPFSQFSEEMMAIEGLS